MLAPTPHRPQPDSLWRAMAARSPVAHAPVSTGSPLARDLIVDVAIVGAGYSGLAAAYALQKRGVDCAVFDANPIGWGASGRNGGVVSSKFRLSFPSIASAYDLDTAKRMHRLAHDGVRVVEQFVPQMINFDVLGGVNFRKGCYPGQEIVARSQYRGTIKRRMSLANVKGETDSVMPGTELFHSDDPGQPCGMLVNTAAAPDGGVDALVEIKLAALENGTVHLGASDGPVLTFLPLPYALPTEV